MKKNIKKNETTNNGVITEIKEEFKRHTNILMEQMKHEVKTVAEGHSILIKKLDKVESEIGEVKKDVHELKQDMVEVKNDVHELKQDMREVKTELGSVKMVVVNISHEINDHEKRIKKVEDKVFV